MFHYLCCEIDPHRLFEQGQELARSFWSFVTSGVFFPDVPDFRSFRLFGPSGFRVI
jgi:hypothetical protein